MDVQTAGDHRTFTASGAADAGTVARLRDAVRCFLEGVVPVDAQRRADILLATDEALSNCADHAYRDRSDGGEMSVELSYRRESGRLDVRVADDGRWIEPARPQPHSARGRGMLLMHALADDVYVDGSGTGTRVRLRFGGCRTSAA